MLALMKRGSTYVQALVVIDKMNKQEIRNAEQSKNIPIPISAEEYEGYVLQSKKDLLHIRSIIREVVNAA